jgi:glycosyltransferase involved in cell wall biosynthesis
MIAYSVVIPAYNAVRTLRETLASVLAQTSPAAEIILVDDGSNDGTADLASEVFAELAAATANRTANRTADLTANRMTSRSVETQAIRPPDGVFTPRLHLVRQANAGPGAATSRGVQLASSPWIAMSDADDVWLPGKMERQLRFLDEHFDVALVCASMRQFRHGEPDDGNGEVRVGPTRSTIVVKREVFLDVGDVIDPPGRCGEMVDWLARFRYRGHRMAAIDEVLALRRVIAGSLSQRRSERHGQGFLAVAHAAMLRQRSARTQPPAEAPLTSRLS